MATSALRISAPRSCLPSLSAMAMPIEAPTRASSSRSAMGAASTCVMRSATTTASSSVRTAASRTANSSPPRRATASASRVTEAMRAATSRRRRSPASWPGPSLTSLKLSRSMKRTAGTPSSAPRGRDRASRTRSWNEARLTRSVRPSWRGRGRRAGVAGLAQQALLGGDALDDAAQLRADVAHDLQQAAVGAQRLEREELEHGDDLVLHEHREGGGRLEAVLARDGLAREVVVLGDVGEPDRAALDEHAAGEVDARREPDRLRGAAEALVRLGVLEMPDRGRGEHAVGAVQQVGVADRPAHEPAHPLERLADRLLDARRGVGGHGDVLEQLDEGHLAAQAGQEGLDEQEGRREQDEQLGDEQRDP